MAAHTLIEEKEQLQQQTNRETVFALPHWCIEDMQKLKCFCALGPIDLFVAKCLRIRDLQKLDLLEHVYGKKNILMRPFSKLTAVTINVIYRHAHLLASLDLYNVFIYCNFFIRVF